MDEDGLLQMRKIVENYYHRNLSKYALIAQAINMVGSTYMRKNLDNQSVTPNEIVMLAKYIIIEM